MPIIALLLGAMATISPFMGLLLMLISLRGLLLRSGGKILSRALLWLVFPVLLGSFTLRQPGSLLIVSDAVFGAGLVSLLYLYLSLIHISEPTRLLSISYAVFCLKKKKKKKYTYH